MKNAFGAAIFLVAFLAVAAALTLPAGNESVRAALNDRGLLEAEAQKTPVAPYKSDVQFVVAAQPTRLGEGIARAILNGSDSSHISALVPPSVQQGDTLVVFRYVDLDAKGQAQAYVLLAEKPSFRFGRPESHILN